MTVSFLAAWRRFLVRRAFERNRLTVYKALSSMLKTSGTMAVNTPTFAVQFALWAQRAASRREVVAVAHAEIQRRLTEGSGLAKAMEPFIPLEESMMIEAGEASGKLTPTLDALINSAAASREIAKATREHYAQPVGLLLGFLAISIFSGLMLWPTLLDALPVKYWDAWALPMMYGQMAITRHPFALSLFVTVYFAYRCSLPRWRGNGRRIAERLLPPYSAYRDRQAAALLIVLAGLLRAGKTMDQALDHVARLGSPYMRWHTRAMQRRLIQFAGDPARILSTGIFSVEILDRIGNAAVSRQLTEAIQYIGTDAIDQVVDSVKVSAAIGGAVLLSFASLLMAYYATVQVIASQSATDRLMREVKTGVSVPHL